jgi:hypothetical protein
MVLVGNSRRLKQRKKQIGDFNVTRLVLYNFTFKATYLFEYLALRGSTAKGHFQVPQTTYKT